MRIVAAALLALAIAPSRIAQGASPETEWKLATPTRGYGFVATSDGHFVAGETEGNCLTFAKRSSVTGAPIWSQTTCGNSEFNPLWFALGADAGGHVVALWRHGNDGWMTAAKYRSDGSTVYQRRVTEQPGLAPAQIVVDPAGDFLVAGFTYDTQTSFFAKFSGATGTVRWRINGSSRAMALDADGNAIIGQQDNTRAPYAATVSKYAASSGERLWQTTFATGAYQGFPGGLATDGSNDVLITGSLYVASFDGAFVTIKLSGSDGEIVWQRTVDTPGSSDGGYAIAVAPTGESAVTGNAANAVKTLKYSAAGELLWEAAYAGRLVSFDPAGDVVVTGMEHHDGQGVVRTVKLAGADGREIWTAGYSDGVRVEMAVHYLAIVASGVLIHGSAKVNGVGNLRMLKYSNAAAGPRNYQSLWWGSPAGSESGWGLNVAHQGEILFLTWFTYGLDGQPMWFVVPDARRLLTDTYGGKLYTTRGPAFNAIPFNPNNVQATEAGNAFVQFSGSNEGVFTYEFSGPISNANNGSKPITRQVFDRMPTCSAGGAQGAEPNYQDLWWASPPGSESGWGVNLTHQGDILFVTWFTYDPGGAGVWYAASRVEKTAPGTYSGALYRTSGPRLNSNPWPATFNVNPVGNVSFTFSDPANGVFSYTLNGVSQSKPITRQLFGTPSTVCR